MLISSFVISDFIGQSEVSHEVLLECGASSHRFSMLRCQLRKSDAGTRAHSKASRKGREIEFKYESDREPPHSKTQARTGNVVGRPRFGVRALLRRFSPL
jgi:hypothetical protein